MSQKVVPEPSKLKPSERARLAEVRRIGKERAKEAGATLSSAFANDPLFLWLSQGRDQDSTLQDLTLQDAQALWWEWMLCYAPVFSEVYAMGDISGVSIWVPSPDLTEELLDKLFKQENLPPDQARALTQKQAKQIQEHQKLALKIFGERADIFPEMFSFVPQGNWWYLAGIGVDPQYFGKGRGSQMLKAKLLHLDLEGQPAYLEATCPQNVSFYIRHGFEVTGEINFQDAPTLYAMWREPK